MPYTFEPEPEIEDDEEGLGHYDPAMEYACAGPDDEPDPEIWKHIRRHWSIQRGGYQPVPRGRRYTKDDVRAKVKQKEKRRKKKGYR